jgi:predicted RNA-binding Zn ribbon-like protein
MALMASTVVDGLVLPISLAGHPVLDFCNTRAGWLAPVPKEYLVSLDHLAVWAGANGLLPPAAVAAARTAAGRSPGPAGAVLGRAVRLRSALYSLLVGPAAAEDWAAVNVEVGRAGAAVRLVPGRPAGWAVAGTGLELPLRSVVWAAARFLTDPAAAAVDACPSHDCGWLFANPTGRRRWCSMALCGNRAKVRRHAQRTRRATRAE